VSSSIVSELIRHLARCESTSIAPISHGFHFARQANFCVPTPPPPLQSFARREATLLGDNDGSSAPTALPSNPTQYQTGTVQNKVCGGGPSDIAATESYRTTVDAFTGSKGPFNLLSDDEDDSDSSRSHESEDTFSKDYRNCALPDIVTDPELRDVSTPSSQA
jgi:hypothetical protein